ncbi:hypothetical protein HMPREF0645_0742 [Hallella bergensis DSM 17361]|uniref:Uncharacterized protein n=1 Tax=Hallella bergensis DSM 17361 TaxID=585502 RepID=D1PUV7_9BACT|nr:hypothetical protein HMPREF0645_0742 [Hallella bergensis DSM 17361]
MSVEQESRIIGQQRNTNRKEQIDYMIIAYETDAGHQETDALVCPVGAQIIE